MRDHEDLDRILSDLSFRSKEFLRHTEHYKTNPTDWHEAWRFSYRAEDELRQLAIRFRDATRLVLDLRLRGIGDISPQDAGYLTRKLLKEYLGCTGPLYAEIYAGLGDTVYAEDSPEATSVVDALTAKLLEVEKLPPSVQEQEVAVLGLLSATLAFRAEPSQERKALFSDALKDILLARIEKISVILELLNEIGTP